MPLLVFDAADPPNLASIKNAGGVGGARYIKKTLPNAYDLEPGERLNFLTAGLGLLYNAEQSANDVLVQSTQFFADYGKYVADRLQSFGVNPTGVNIPLSADCQVSDTALPKAMNNLAAFAANCAPFGMTGYGQMNVLQLLTEEGISPKGAKHWLTGSISWSKGYTNTPASWNEYIQFPYAGMVQLGPQAVGWFKAPTIAECDTNILLDPTAMGFEWPESSPYAPREATPMEYIIDDPAGGSWHTFDGGKEGITPALLTQLLADGVKHLTVNDTNKTDLTNYLAALPTAGLASPGEAQIVNLLGELLAAIKAIPASTGAAPTAAQNADATADEIASRLGGSPA